MYSKYNKCLVIAWLEPISTYLLIGGGILLDGLRLIDNLRVVSKYDNLICKFIFAGPIIEHHSHKLWCNLICYSENIHDSG